MSGVLSAIAFGDGGSLRVDGLKENFMCFSANASFIASALLLLSSIFTLKRAQPKQRMLAAIPLLFSIQQFCEGLVWLGLASDNYPTMAIYSYLFFVEIVWPLWVPFAVRYTTTNNREKNALRLPIIAGFLIAIITIVCFFTMPPISAQIEDHHIYYAIPLPQWLQITTSFLYLIATLVPFFIVKHRYFRFMGTMLALSYIASLIFFYHYHLSMWCFFVAIMSIFMFFFLG